jgi:hypothetical protein
MVVLIARFARAVAGLTLSILLAALAEPAAAAGASLEYAVKAAFLVKFAPFVTWPATAAESGPFRICVLGHAPFGASLNDAVRGRSMGERPIVVRHLNAVTPEAACQVLYVGRTSAQTPREALAAVRGQPVLTVTDAGQGADRGIVHFVVVDGHVRFAIDVAAARANGLAVSSKLLDLAINLRQVEP